MIVWNKENREREREKVIKEGIKREKGITHTLTYIKKGKREEEKMRERV